MDVPDADADANANGRGGREGLAGIDRPPSGASDVPYSHTYEGLRDRLSTTIRRRLHRTWIDFAQALDGDISADEMEAKALEWLRIGREVCDCSAAGGKGVVAQKMEFLKEMWEELDDGGEEDRTQGFWRAVEGAIQDTGHPELHRVIRVCSNCLDAYCQATWANRKNRCGPSSTASCSSPQSGSALRHDDHQLAFSTDSHTRDDVPASQPRRSCAGRQT